MTIVDGKGATKPSALIGGDATHQQFLKMTKSASVRPLSDEQVKLNAHTKNGSIQAILSSAVSTPIFYDCQEG